MQWRYCSNIRLTRSLWLAVYEWNLDGSFIVYLRICNKQFQNVEMNWGPWSNIMSCDWPCKTIFLIRRSVRSSSDTVLECGMKYVIFVRWPVTAKTTSEQLMEGREVIKSVENEAHGCAGTGRGCNNLNCRWGEDLSFEKMSQVLV